MPSLQQNNYWFVIPAAGIGARMNAHVPKQYLKIGGRTILECTLARVLALPNLAGVVVALSAEDDCWHKLNLSQHSLVHSVIGGASRAESVLNGLSYLKGKANADDWILVHDAARPCVTLGSINDLIEQLSQSDVGGILSVPVSDTLKKVAQSDKIQTTINRENLWQAQTPQMFRYQLLRDCLEKALSTNANITDESSAVELYGYSPTVVEGRSDNIKVTRPDDLLLAEFIMQQQEKYL